MAEHGNITALSGAVLDWNGTIIDASGNLDLASSNRKISFEGTRFLHAFRHPTGGTIQPNGDNVFLGRRCGNETVGSTATTAVHGSYNVGLGADNLDALTTGNYNISVGRAAFGSATTYEAGIAIGGLAFTALVSGARSIAIGHEAGRKITGGAINNTISNNGIYIGYQSKAFADGQNGEIVIGQDTTGHGSSTVTLGSTVIISNHLNGALILVQKVSQTIDSFNIKASDGVTDLAVFDVLGQLGIGIDPDYGIDMVGVNGFARFSDSSADSETKTMRLVSAHYLNAENPVTGFYAINTAGSNTINFGGGTGFANAVTGIGFWTASNNTTATGTRAMNIGTTQYVSIGAHASITARLHVENPASAANNLFKLSSVDDGDLQIVNSVGHVFRPELATPTPIADMWSIYSKTNRDLYFQDGAGKEHVIHGAPFTKSDTFAARTATSGTYYLFGFYDGPSTSVTLTNASTTVNLGSANNPYGAHAFIVSGGNGTTDGSDLVLTVTGTSITDAGVRVTADSEVVEATAGTSALDSYFETVKKWLGTVVYTLSSTGGSAFSYTFNYGYAKYDDIYNTSFDIDEFEATGLANANDSGFNIELLHHRNTGWTYAASGFIPGDGAITNMNSVYSTEQDLVNGEQFAFKITGLDTAIDGAGSEGFLVRITTGANNSVSYLNAHVGYCV